MIGSHRILTGSRCTGSPSTVVSSTPCAVTTAMSWSSRITTSRVCDRMAGISEAMNISSLPRPTTTLPAPCLAATSRSGALAATTPTAYEPRHSPNARRAGGVVAPVLQALEAFHDDPDRVLAPDIPDNSTHGLFVLLGVAAALTPSALGPAFLDDLRASLQGEGPRWYVPGDDRARPDIRAIPDRDGRDQARVGTDERPVADHRL